MKVALDTSVLVCAFSRREPHHLAAAALLGRVAPHTCVQPMQTFGEFFFVVTRKHRCPAADAMAAVAGFRALVSTATATEPDFEAAMLLTARHRVQFWDALIWVTARRAGCRAILTQDMPGIADLDGMIFVNPFLPESERMLRLLLPPAEH